MRRGCLIVAAVLGLGWSLPGSIASAAVLYSNGSIVTESSGGPGGFAVSRYSSDFSTYGFSANSPIRLADNFSVGGANPWAVNTITVQAYVNSTYTVPPASSPILGVAVRIWAGLPDASQLLAQSVTVTGNAFSGIWRTSTGNPAETNRPVFDLTVDFGSVVLAPGNYWMDYSVVASGNPFSPMVMDVVGGEPVTRNGNAMRKLDANGEFVTLFGGTGPQGLDVPFVIGGTVVVPEPGWAGIVAGLGLMGVCRRRGR